MAEVIASLSIFCPIRRGRLVRTARISRHALATVIFEANLPSSFTIRYSGQLFYYNEIVRASLSVTETRSFVAASKASRRKGRRARMLEARFLAKRADFTPQPLICIHADDGRLRSDTGLPIYLQGIDRSILPREPRKRILREEESISRGPPNPSGPEAPPLGEARPLLNTDASH
ncbi:hypothetical protein KM043_004470 [Ampulex compressa]|nr:hypothetical protein KM043_004470 [Ampulex compressa]